MTLKEFRAAVSTSLKDQLGRFLPVYFYPASKDTVFLKVKYSSEAGEHESYIDYIYVDNKKKRLFFVGKSDEKRAASWFNKHIKSFLVRNILKWAREAKNRRDEFEVYFAWSYDYKDSPYFDYIPLGDEVEVKPSASRFEVLEFNSVPNADAMKIKMTNLHESIKRLEEEAKAAREKRTLD